MTGTRQKMGVAGLRLAIVTLVVLLATALFTASMVGRVVRDQEAELLERRANEASTLLSSLLDQLTSSLPLMGVLSRPDVGNPVLFEGLAGQFLQDQDGAIYTVERRHGAFVVTLGAGDGPAVGAPLRGAREALADRALSADGMVTAVEGEGDMRRLVVALPVDANAGLAIVQELEIDISGALGTDPESPFSELEGAVYAVPRVDPEALILTTTDDLPVYGSHVETRTLEIGEDRWRLVVAPRRPLVGTFADRAPWATLATGLLAAVLVSALVGVLGRRRTYAVNLVEARTQELREALAAQERLETSQREARESAEAANRSKSEFVSRMSHELRTPLNAVLGFAQLLEIEDLAPADRESVEQILKGGRHLLDLINEVLDITRIETGTLQMSSEPVLVANAIKYNRDGGTVVLTCARHGADSLRIAVRDTGPGIRPEHLDLVFTPCERLGAEQTGIEGTGIGLALSQHLAEAMGGTLGLETTVGVGSVFWIDLPLVEGPLERFHRIAGDEADVTTEGLAPGATTTVLYVEDNLANLRLVERLLESFPDVELLTAMQGQMGFELARDHRPSLVLLDLHLPDIDGHEVLRRLREAPETRAIPVVVVSADASAGQIQRLLDDGAQQYLTKPIDVVALRVLITDAMSATR